MRPAWRIALRATPLCAVLAIWQIAGAQSNEVRFFYATPTAVIGALGQDLWHGDLATDVLITVASAVAGLAVGAATGFAAALLLSSSRLGAFIAAPYIAFLGSIPIVAISPLVILWFGTGANVSIAVAALSSMILVTAQVFEGLHQSIDSWSRLGRSFQASWWGKYRYLVLPGAAAWLFSSWRAAIGLALIGAFVGEFISANVGLGRYILRAGALYDAPRVFAGILLIGLVGVGLNVLMEKIEQSVFPWRASLKQSLGDTLDTRRF